MCLGQNRYIQASMKQGIMIIAILCSSIAVMAQGNGYKQLPGGVSYKLLANEQGDNHPDYGDYVETHMYLNVDGKEIYSSRKTGEGKPVGFLMKQQATKTDIQEAIKLMTPGDSASVLLSVDSMIKAGSGKLAWMKPGTGQQAEYIIKLLRVKNISKKK